MKYNIIYTKNMYKFTKTGKLSGLNKSLDMEIDAKDEEEARELFTKHYSKYKLIRVEEEPKII